MSNVDRRLRRGGRRRGARARQLVQPSVGRDGGARRAERATLVLVTPRLRASLLVLAGAAACNAVTGTGKYEIVDCPEGSCVDSGGTPSRDAQSNDSATSDASDVDVAEPLPTCPDGRSPVRLTVTGTAGGSVSSNSGGLQVAAGSTQTACLPNDTVELRTNGPGATWTGVSCKDGNSGRDRCEFSVRPGGMILTAALP